jgi:diadenosine tetraphosphatase ApaH/serine/threonine PP2A family protein phosphatase
MKLALLSDVHANLQALEACLADARIRGATDYAFLGDLVGYGADPGKVLDIIMAMAAAGASVVRGNHDDAALAPVPNSERADQAGAVWTAAQLTPPQREFLAGLPLVMRLDFICLVHASAREPQRWEYVQDSMGAAASLQAAEDRGTTHVFGGHVHEQRLFFHGAVGKVMAFEPTPGVAVPLRRHRRWLATVGAVGQPRDGRSEAMYAVFDSASAELTFLRVPYDHQAAAQSILAAGLPESNARRLALGQ